MIQHKQLASYTVSSSIRLPIALGCKLFHQAGFDGRATGPGIPIAINWSATLPSRRNYSRDVLQAFAVSTRNSFFIHQITPPTANIFRIILFEDHCTLYITVCVNKGLDFYGLVLLEWVRNNISLPVCGESVFRVHKKKIRGFCCVFLMSRLLSPTNSIIYFIEDCICTLDNRKGGILT